MLVLRTAWLAAALLCSAALADEVTLKNGDRISGAIVSRAAGKLHLRTAHAGEVAIEWRQVESIRLVDALGNSREASLAEVAELHPEPHEIEGRVVYSGRATVAANYSTGNVESERLYGEAGLDARAKKYRYALSGRAERRTDPLLGTVSSWLGAANYDWFLEEKKFIYTRGSVEHDEVKSIKLRSAVGAGYGLQLHDTERLRLSVRSGLDYVAVERVGAPDDRYPAFGWGVRLDYSPWGPRLELFHEQEGFWNLEDTRVANLRSKTGVRVPLVNRLNATAQVNVDWERSPPPPRESTDTVLLLGVDYTW